MLNPRLNQGLKTEDCSKKVGMVVDFSQKVMKIMLLEVWKAQIIFPEYTKNLRTNPCSLISQNIQMSQRNDCDFRDKKA